ncbi:MAG: DnaJ domain-containing protein [Pyrinomonadaceae bacterium]|nr:DnaJ domain-containing protein [Pyrinomonadaceae bacterium]
MNNQLREHPLAEVLRQISAERVSGVVRLARERVKAIVYCNEGEIVFVSSNLRAHRLLECLARWGQSVPQDKLQEASEKNFSSDAELGHWLVTHNVVTAEGLGKLQSLQATGILRPALLWTEGEWSFDPRTRIVEETRATLHPQKLFLEAARRLPAEYVETRLGNDAEIVSPANEASPSVELLPSEAFVLSRVDAPLSVGEIVALSGLGEREARQIIYTLALGSFLDRRAWPPVLDEQMLEQVKLIGERKLKQPAAAATTTVTANSQPTGKPAALPVADVTTTAGDAVTASTLQPDVLSNLNALFARAKAATPYEVLGVTTNAPPAKIKAAYYALAKSYHPDRFHKEVAPDERFRIETAFARIAQAYETLKNTATRAGYDLKLKSKGGASASQTDSARPRNAETTKPSSPSVTTKPETPMETPIVTKDSSGLSNAAESFRQGMAAMNAGNHPLAVLRLGEAARLAPQEAKHRAFFGQALAQEGRTRRQAEAEILAAIALDARNASYRVMLAALYHELNLRRRVEGELRRALAIDPQNEAAQRLLAELQKAS